MTHTRSARELVSPDGDRALARLKVRPRWFLPTLAFFVGCALALVMGEIAVRIAEPRADTPGLPLPGSARLYGFAPNSTGYAGGVAFWTNSSGFRGEDFTSIDPEQDVVVMVLGDSYSFGYGVQANEAYPAVLEADLRERYPARRLRVVNLAIPGYDTSQELATLQEWGPRLHPRFVLLQYHLNDISRHDEGSGPQPHDLRGVLTALGAHIHVLRFMLPRIAAIARSLHWHGRTTATAELAEYVGNGPAWQRNQQALGELITYARSLGAATGVLVVPYVVQLNAEHGPAPAYEVVMRFVDAMGVPAENAFEDFKGQNARDLWINAFDGHPNARGQMLMEHAAGRLMERMLEKP